MLGKIIDGVLTYPPHRIILNGMQIFNPTDDQLIQVGYKTVTETPIPEDPAPAYVVPNPNCCYNYGNFGFNNGCGCNNGCC